MNRETSRTFDDETEGSSIADRLRSAGSGLVAPHEIAVRALARSTDRLVESESPLGPVFVGVSDIGVRMLGRDRSVEDFSLRYRRRAGRLLARVDDAESRRLSRAIASALAGGRSPIEIDLTGATSFQERVMEVVRTIPRGEVRPYAWVAHQAGSPGASRAVGTIMANNPIPLIVPCHRVVRNSGEIGAYMFGTERKQEILSAEGVHLDELAGGLYLGTPTTRIFCHATCPNARRIRPENRRRFRSSEAAVNAGFRPCRVCRPAVAAAS